MILYSRDHLWVRAEAGGRARIGVTAHAQSELGDILYVDLPEAGSALCAGEAFGVIESVKTASDLHAPVDGTVAAVNASIKDEPWQVNDAPEDAGWLLEIACAPLAPSDYLMDEAAYLGQL